MSGREGPYFFFSTSSRPVLVRSLPSMAFLKSSRISGGMGLEGPVDLDFDMVLDARAGDGFFDFRESLRPAVPGGRMVFVRWMTCRGTRCGGAMAVAGEAALESSTACELRVECQ